MHTDKDVYFNTVCLQTHALTVFSNKNNPAITSRYAHRKPENYDQFLRTLLASSCQPLLWPPITMQTKEEPVPQYIDAGEREYSGIEIAIASGATDIYTILSSPTTMMPEDKEYKDLFSILQETLDIFIADTADNNRILPNLYNERLRYIHSVKMKMKGKGVPESAIDDWFDTGMPENPYYNQKQVKLHIIRLDLPF